MTPRPLKYPYNIDKITTLLNTINTKTATYYNLSEIAIELKYPRTPMIHWINRYYDRNVAVKIDIVDETHKRIVSYISKKL